MSQSLNNKKRITTIVLAWLIFIGLDFLFHASLFSTHWSEDIAALKPLKDLALLIPAGYLSFLLLTALVGYVFFRIFKTKPELKKVVQFGFIFALLFSLSNFFGLFSYIDLPLKNLVVINFVYFIEILVVTISLYYTAFSSRLKKSILYTLLIFIGLIILGVVIQNISANF